MFTLLLCLGVGILGSLVTARYRTWYAGLVKPFWTPPPFVFPIAWSVLYLMMAISFWRVWDLETRSTSSH